MLRSRIDKVQEFKGMVCHGGMGGEGQVTVSIHLHMYMYIYMCMCVT